MPTFDYSTGSQTSWPGSSAHQVVRGWTSGVSGRLTVAAAVAGHVDGTEEHGSLHEGGDDSSESEQRREDDREELD